MAMCLLGAGAARAQPAPVSGQALSGLEPFDSEVLALLQAWKLPGASLAVAKDGRLVLARGYGFSDRAASKPMEPTTLLRVGSITKVVTAVAVLRQVEAGKLALDDPVLPLLARRGVAAGARDPRWSRVTIRHLLQHAGGMDRELSGDPFFPPMLGEVARRQRVAPVTCEAIIADQLQRELDFEPGERFAYSNTGYCMLGRVLEAATGEPFAEHVSRSVLRPATGRDFLAARTLQPWPGEARYHDDVRETLPAAPGLAGPGVRVPAPYGSFSLESMDALGAWVTTPSDVLRFFLAVDGARGTPLLQAATLREFWAPPAYLGNTKPQGPYRALGVEARAVQGGLNWWHTGSQAGLQALAVRTARGHAWAIVFNGRPPLAQRGEFVGQIDRALWRAAGAVKAWPSGDLF